MDNRLRRALERRGLPASASERDAQDFYAQLTPEEKGRLGVELGGPEVRVPDDPEVQVREEPYDPDLTTRSIALRAQTIDEGTRSVQATIVTDRPVEVWDWRRGEVIDEVLRIDGTELPAELEMLANHNRWELDAVLGTARELSRARGEVLARLFFVEDDPEVEKVWNKVRQRHLRNMSVGYRVRQSVTIDPGTTQTVGGREYTAADRALRIATQWDLREVSVVVLGADQLAKIRNQQATLFHGKRGSTMDPKTMNPKLKKYLESIGLRAGASDEEAEKFYKALDGEKRTRADEIKAASERTPSDAPSNPPADPPAEPNRSTPPPELPPTDPAAIARQVLSEERDRLRQIAELAGDDVPDNIRDRAIHEGWDLDRAGREFLGAVREHRTQIQRDFADGTPAIHSRSHDGDLSVRSLAAGMLRTRGLDPTKHRLHNGQREPGRVDMLTEEDADRGERFRFLSGIDLVRECVRLDTGRNYLNPREAFRAAISGTSLDRVFTTNVNAELVAGWTETPDSTSWCQETDRPNFLTAEEISLKAGADLDRHTRGATAKHATAEDDYEPWKIYRFSKQFVADEMDIIDDRLGALLEMPREMGAAARRLRPDLVYAILLANAALTATTGALFNATAETTAGGHANQTTAVLGAVGLKAAITAMNKKRIGKKVLNISPRYLLYPPECQWDAWELLTSVRYNHTGDADAYFPDQNPLSRLGIQGIPEDRLSATGCTDPITGTAYAGSATNWFLAAERKTIKVGYRRGTNRGPELRSFVLTQGQWGLGWDINLDIGAKAVDYRGLHRSTGAG